MKLAFSIGFSFARIIWRPFRVVRKAVGVLNWRNWNTYKFREQVSIRTIMIYIVSQCKSKPRPPIVMRLCRWGWGGSAQPTAGQQWYMIQNCFFGVKDHTATKATEIFREEPKLSPGLHNPSRVHSVCELASMTAEWKNQGLSLKRTKSVPCSNRWTWVPEIPGHSSSSWMKKAMVTSISWQLRCNSQRRAIDICVHSLHVSYTHSCTSFLPVSSSWFRKDLLKGLDVLQKKGSRVSIGKGDGYAVGDLSIHQSEVFIAS